MFKCEICGKEYADIASYAACVGKCADQARHEEERRKEEELQKQKTERLQKINKMHNDLSHEVKSFAKDYGYAPFSMRFSLSELLEDFLR